MAFAARLPLVADRSTPFARTLRFVGADMSKDALHAQVRLYPNAPGAPLIDLPIVTDYQAQGLRFIDVDTGNYRPVSRFALLIPSLASMPAPAEPGDDLILFWDLHWTPLNGVKQRRLYGEFTVQGGVTR